MEMVGWPDLGAGLENRFNHCIPVLHPGPDHILASLPGDPLMRRIYICQLCDWKKISEDILDFNVHASTDHRDFFFVQPEGKHPTRNDKRLRDYVELEPIVDGRL